MADGTPEQDFARFRGEHDASALGSVFDALAPELLLVAAHFARDAAAAEDLVQATFVDAIRRAPLWDAARPLLPWLLGILVNHARLERRRERRALDAERLAARSPRAEPEPPVTAEQHELAEALGRALQRLPRHYRQALTLRLVHGLAPREIARVVGCPPATVKTRLQRGAALLRQALPVGLTAAVAGIATPARGLAAVRDAVVAAADMRATAAAATTAAAALGGGMVVKQIAVVAGAMLLGLALWWSAMSAGAPDSRGDARTAVPAPRSAEALTAAPAPASVEPATRTALDSAPSPATGSARLRFTWVNGAPAAGIRVACLPEVFDVGVSHRGGLTDEDGCLLLANLPPGSYTVRGRSLFGALEIRAGEPAERTFAVPAFVRVQGVVVDAGGQSVAGAVIRRRIPAPGILPLRVATTGDDGGFAFASEFAGPVWAERAGMQSSAFVWTTEGESRIQLVLGAPGTALAGTVRAPGGAPVAGAAVVVIADPRRASAEAPPPVCMRTDRDGRFATRELSSAEQIVVVCDGEHAPAVVPVVPSATRATELAIDLQAAAAVRGTARDARGAPLRARIEARPFWLTRAVDEVVYGLLARTTGSDAGGSFALRSLSPGSVRLEASSQDRVAASATLALGAGEDAVWDPVLGGGASITGRVVGPAGEPLRRWNVEANPIGAGTYRTAVSDDDGHFTLVGLTAREYRVEVVPELRRLPPGARELPYVTAVLAAGAADVVLRSPCTPQDGGAFRGCVVGATGEPIRTARVRLRRPSDVGAIASEKVGDDGCFRWAGLPPGDYAVHVDIAGHGMIALGTHRLDAGEEVDLGAIRTGGLGIARLRIATPEGEALDGAAVRMHDAAGNAVGYGSERALLRFARAPDGSLRSPPLPAGTYEVALWGPWCAPQQRTLSVAEGGETELEIVAPTAAPVHLRFAVPEGWRHPLRELHLEVRFEDERGASAAIPWVDTGDPDCFVLPRGFAPGRYRAVATELPSSAHGDARPLSGATRFAVEPGQRGPLDVEIALR